MNKMVMSIEYETRLCEVNGEIGAFHTWNTGQTLLTLVRYEAAILADK